MAIKFSLFRNSQKCTTNNTMTMTTMHHVIPLQLHLFDSSTHECRNNRLPHDALTQNQKYSNLSTSSPIFVGLTLVAIHYILAATDAIYFAMRTAITESTNACYV